VASTPRRQKLALVGALVAKVMVPVDAARLDALAARGALASMEPVGAMAPAPAPTMTQPVAAVMPDGDQLFLTSLADYVESIDLQAKLTLSHIRTALYHLERFTDEIERRGLVGDARAGEAARALLGDMAAKTEQLVRLAAVRKAQGDVDDGGDILPSQRDNICKAIDRLDFGAEFRNQVKGLCQALDIVRSTILAGEDEENVVLNVNGRLQNLRTLREYERMGVSYAIGFVLAEEWRWVHKQLAQRRAIHAGARDSTRRHNVKTSAGQISPWMDEAVAITRQAPEAREMRLHTGFYMVDRIHPEELNSLSALRTALQNLELCKNLVAEIITDSDPVGLERIRELLRLIADKARLLKALAMQREAAGEVDLVMELPASQRDNICKHLDRYDIAPELRRDVSSMCDSFELLRKRAAVGGDTDSVMMDIFGRMQTLKRRPAYQDARFAGQLELVFSEELRWLETYTASSHQQ